LALGVILTSVMGAAFAQNYGLDKFTFGIDVDPQTLDPTMVNRTQARYVYSTIFDPLIHRAPDGSLEPRVLDSWEWVDSTTIRLTVHEGITFHDGSPLTAEDVAFTIERTLDPGSAQSTSFSSVSEVKLIDSRTVEVLLSRPDPTVIVNYADLVYVVPSDYYQEVGADRFANEPIGSGPFKFEEWIKDYSVRLSANDNYWKGPVEIGEIEFRILQEESTRVAALQTGEVDMINYFPFHMIGGAGDRVEVVEGSSPDLIYLGLVPSSPVLDDIRVRVAINHAIDREGIAQALQGSSVVLGGTLIPGIPGYEPPLEPYTYDPSLARQILAEAGYRGQELRFDVPLGRLARSQDLAQLLAAQMQAVGLNVRINEVEWGLFTDMLYRRKGQQFTDMWIFHAKSSNMDPDSILGRTFHSKGGWNWGRVNNPELDELLDAALVEQDPARREEMYRHADQVVKDEAYYVPLYVLKVWYGLRKDRSWSWEPRSDEMFFLWDDLKLN